MSNRTGRAAVLTLIGFIACGSINCRGYRTAVELDKVAKSIDEYGFASISAPFLAAPSEVFEFDLNKSADYYFERANSPQGAARVLNSQAVDTQVQIRVNIEQALQTYAQYSRAKTIADFREAQRKAKAQLALLDPLLDAATAWQSAAEKAAVNAATVGNPVANIWGNQFVDGTQEARVAQLAAVKGMLSSIAEQEEPDAEALPGFVATTQPVADKPPFAVADRNAFNAVGGSFTPGLEMPSGPFSISAREAMLIASGDMATQSLLKWFMRPQGNKLRNYELYFCPIIVSVQPGYETRNNFQADVTVNVDLARPGKDECEFEYLSDKFGRSSIPVQVAGVFPVLDAQVLDLANSQRRLYAMAFQLATLGFGSQANFFSDFAKKLELDVETRSSLTSGTAYTIGSTAFGFRVEPKNVGIKGGLEIDAKPGESLESLTFPAMAVLLVDRSYLFGQQEYCGSECHPYQEDHQVTPHSPQQGNKYPYLVFRSSVRWSPIRAGFAGLTPKRQSEVDLWRRAKALDEAQGWLSGDDLIAGNMDKFYSIDHLSNVKGTFQQDLLDSRIRALSKIGLESRALVRVYHTKPLDKVLVTDILPDRGWTDQWTVLTVRGAGFKGNVKTVTVGGVFCEFDVVSDSAMLVSVPPWESKRTELAAGLGSLRAATDAQAEYLESKRGPQDDIQSDMMNGMPLSDTERKTLEDLMKAVENKELGPQSAGLWQHYESLLARSAIPKAPVPSNKSSSERPALTDTERETYEALAAKVGKCELNPTNPAKWALYQDLQQRDHIPPALSESPLTPSELATLDGLGKLVAACKLGPGHVKWSYYLELRTRALINDRNDRLKKKRDIAEAQHEKHAARWAQIVIGADSPVQIACGNEQDDGNCTARRSFPSTRHPASIPNSEVTLELSPFSKECRCSLLGWVLFNKTLPVKPSSPKSGTITITRDNTGNITGIKTGDGGFDNGAKLLEIARESLCCELEKCKCQRHGKRIGDGAVVIQNCGVCGKCERKCRCTDEAKAEKPKPEKPAAGEGG